jgi:hypothetical protein
VKRGYRIVTSNSFYISDYIDTSLICKDKFNLIASGTGTGKSYFVINSLQKRFPEIKPNNIIFVTSRAMIVDQQTKNDGISKLHLNNYRMIDYWNGDDKDDLINNSDMFIMPYNSIIDIINNNRYSNKDSLENVEMIIFDECHTMFSDKFIDDIKVLRMWVENNIRKGKIIFLGLTATPHIVDWYIDSHLWGVEINRLNEDIIIRYRANQLICTDFDSIPSLITSNTISGKTMIMCCTVDDCRRLKSEIPNSTILISKNNNSKNNTDLLNPHMNKLRQYIVDNSSLPDTYEEPICDGSGKEVDYKIKKLEVLLTTSTLREGVNIEYISNVKNIISCFTDELHIIQFAGRCRYNIDNLVVADTYVRSDNRKPDPYLSLKRDSFKEFLNKTNNDWFDSICHIVNHPIYKTIIYKNSKEVNNFIKWINKKWLIPLDINENELKNYYIYKYLYGSLS